MVLASKSRMAASVLVVAVNAPNRSIVPRGRVVENWEHLSLTRHQNVKSFIPNMMSRFVMSIFQRITRYLSAAAGWPMFARSVVIMITRDRNALLFPEANLLASHSAKFNTTNLRQSSARSISRNKQRSQLPPSLR